ncbi:M56 family metallopeptidase [Myxococcus sp. Y35]|uniref:M56 family metallopeptidase n=1 Tax=Pseudomyxococcus flavus TaxID=3115648 RepID=UPI003CEE215A
MGTEWLSHVGEWASSGLWRASWQGALWAVLVWAVSRAFPKLPASLRAGLWWLVALKFVVALGWLPSVSLPVLPASAASGWTWVEARWDEATTRGAGMRASVTSVLGLRGDTGSGERSDGRGAIAAQATVGQAPATRSWGTARETGNDVVAHALEAPQGASHSSLSVEAARGEPVSWWPVERRADVMGGGVTAAGAPWTGIVVGLLLALWVAGVVWHVGRHVKGGLAMRRLLRVSRPLEHPMLEAEVRSLSEVAGLRRAPALRVSEGVSSPLATGLFAPVVVLPAKAVRRLPMEALRMALAHELAHLRRGDLWLGWVPALAESLLFFHPLARRAAREYALAREEACDAEALRLTGAEPADYGELILAFGIARAPGTAAVLGASSHHVDALHRRLSMLEHVDAVSTRSRRLLKVALCALGAAALVPFQVVAREADGARAPSSGKGDAASPAQAPMASSKASPSRDAVAQRDVTRTASADKAASTPAAAPVASAPSAATAGKVASAPAATSTPSMERRVAVVSPSSAVAVGTPDAIPVVAAVPALPAPPPAPPRVTPPAPPPAPRVAVASPHLIGTVKYLGATPPPAPPAPPAPMPHGGPDSGYVLLADGMAMMNGTTVDLELARTFKQKDKAILFVRRKGEAFIIRDAATLKSVREALTSTRALGESQSKLGEKQSELGRQQAALGQKQATLGHEQGGLGRKLGDLAYQQSGLHLEESRLGSLPEAERASRRAELKKQEAELEKQMKVIETQMAELARKMESLGEEQHKLSEKQHALHEEQAKLSAQHQARMQEAEKKVHALIDEALSKGLGQPLPT